MGKWRLYVPILLSFLCLSAFLIHEANPWQSTPSTPADLEFRDEVHDLAIKPYYDEAEDAYLLFLPSCTSPSDLSATDPFTGNQVSFSQRDIPLGTDKSVPRTALDLTLSGTSYSITVWQCNQLPTLFLQGRSNLLSKVHADKQNKVTVQAKILDDSGTVMLQEFGTLSGRGNGTWSDFERGQAKRPYNLQFSNPISFGPFENLKDFCLLAEYSDETRLRNRIAFSAGQALGLDYASPYSYINLYVNGEYLGLYGFATKKEYAKHITADQLQGVFEISSNYSSPTFFSDPFEQPIEVMYGQPDHIQNVVDRFSLALSQEDQSQYPVLADLNSFSLMYALEEFLCNPDMVHASQYFYLDAEDVLHSMLPWDFDYSLGSAITHFNPHQERTIMAYRHLSGVSWYPMLLQWEGFRQCVAETIQTYFTDAFLEEMSLRLLQDIHSIENSRSCDIRRWKAAEPFTSSPISSGMQSSSEFYTFFTDFFQKRRDFLLDYFQNLDNYCCITLMDWDGTWYHNVCIPKGSRPFDYIDEDAFLHLVCPKDSQSRILVTDTGIPFSQLDTVSSDLTLITQWR